MKSKQQNLTQAGVLLLLSSVIVKIIGALFKIPLASDSVLGDLGFGYFSSAYDLYLPLYTLALSGFPVAISRLVAEFAASSEEGKIRKIFSVSFKSLIAFGALGSILLCLASLLILFFAKGDTGFIYSVLAIAPSVFFCAVISVYRGYFEGMKNMVPTAVSSVLEALGKLVLGLGFAVAVMKLTGNPALAAAGAMMGIALGTAFSFIYLILSFKGKNEFSKKLKLRQEAFSGDMFKLLLLFAIPIALSSLVVGITSLIDSVTLRSQLSELINKNSENAEIILTGTTYQNMDSKEIPTVIYGIKSKVHTLFNLSPTFTTALSMGALPIMTEAFVKGDKKLFKENADRLLKLSSVIALPIAFGFLACGKEIMTLLYSEESADLSGKILEIYGIAAFFGGLAVPTITILQAIKKQKAALYSIFAGIGVKLLCNLALTPIAVLNVFGTVIGTVLCFAVIFVLNIIIIVKSLDTRLNIKHSFLYPGLSALLCGITAFTVKSLSSGDLATVVAIGLGAAVYFVLLWTFKVISKDEVTEMLKK